MMVVVDVFIVCNILLSSVPISCHFCSKILEYQVS
jgi:hypothetical protein